MNLNDQRKICKRHINNLRQKFGLNPNPDQLSGDDRRPIGRYWEIMFCALVWERDKPFTPHQIGRPENPAIWYSNNGSNKSFYLLPDITVWSHPVEHHEIKHKNPFIMDDYGPVFGLEEPRFLHLLDFQRVTQQDVLYTIHNYDLAGGNLDIRNDISHWITVPITSLVDTWVHRQEKGKTLYNGRFEKRPILYWCTDLWSPLAFYWKILLGDSVVAWANEQGAMVSSI